jgi:hypothetical protein
LNTNYLSKVDQFVKKIPIIATLVGFLADKLSPKTIAYANGCYLDQVCYCTPTPGGGQVVYNGVVNNQFCSCCCVINYYGVYPC